MQNSQRTSKLTLQIDLIFEHYNDVCIDNGFQYIYTSQIAC